MPLFEVETDEHIIITWAADDNAASDVVREAYPQRQSHPHDEAAPRHLGDQQRGCSA